MENLVKILQATGFFAIVAVTVLGGFAAWKVTDQAEMAEVLRIGITAICSLASGGVGLGTGFVIGKKSAESLDPSC